MSSWITFLLARQIAHSVTTMREFFMLQLVIQHEDPILRAHRQVIIESASYQLKGGE